MLGFILNFWLVIFAKQLDFKGFWHMSLVSEIISFKKSYWQQNYFSKYLPVIFLNISAYLFQYGPGPTVTIFSWHAFHFTKPDVCLWSHEWNPFIRKFIHPYILKIRNPSFASTKRGLTHLKSTLSSLDTSQLIYDANQMAAFNMMGTLALNEKGTA